MKDGGHAFPAVEFYDEKPVASHVGMTLRDYFAAQALAGLLANDGTDSTADEYFDERAKRAYAQADAMLAARKG